MRIVFAAASDVWNELHSCPIVGSFGFACVVR